MKVTFYNRRPARGNFSIERVFNAIKNNLPKDLERENFIPRYVSKGLFTRLYDIVESAFHQSDINHITGDVHFLSYLLRKNKTILTIHDCGYRQSEMSQISKAIVKLFWYQIPARRVAYITTISQFSKNEIRSVIKTNPVKIIVIPNPLLHSFSYHQKKFNYKKPNILQIGTTANKNLPNTFKALEGLRCRLTIIGHLSDKHLSLLGKYCIEYINLTDLSDKQIIKEYHKCDLVTFASTYEGFGMPIIEANAVGRPVVTSNIAPMNDVAGNSACLVDPHDYLSIKKGILKIINNARYRDEMIKRGIENAKRFSPEVIANQYMMLYKKIYQTNSRKYKR